MSVEASFGSVARAAPDERFVRWTAAAIFAAAAALTLGTVRGMSGGMEMPGGWTMSMMWMVMPGQTATTAALVFLAMWLAMMVAMMLPSALPLLLIYRRVMSFRGERSLGRHLWAMGSGYFIVWLAFGALAYGIGVAAARVAMMSEIVSHLVPLASGIALAVAGAYQLTPWKLACLKHCRDPLRLIAHHLDHGGRGAFGIGLHHGTFCAGCCWGLMLIQLMIGVMSLGAMVAVAAVIAAEKLLVRGELVARATGVAAISAGAVIVARSLLG